VVRQRRGRLDELLVARGLAGTRSIARGLIMAGRVSVDGLVVDKAGTAVRDEAHLFVKPGPRFVSRAGEKLNYALEWFGVVPAGVMALDVGSSTGGFVDCLLQHGAREVIAVDVGHGQLDIGLRNDPRVHVLEKVNARSLAPSMLPFRADFLTMDVSFISVRKVLPAAAGCLTERFEGLVLVKPQFEAGPASVGKGGIVRDAEVHRTVLVDLSRFVVDECGLDLYGISPSGLRGADGNIEFFLHLGRGVEKSLGLDRLEAAVTDLLGTKETGSDWMRTGEAHER
jgi:23S rRNA (cytidine1920-2'-O)/16S rRNA (cytidine1409-2'-O)-methyltransferase